MAIHDAIQLLCAWKDIKLIEVEDPCEIHAEPGELRVLDSWKSDVDGSNDEFFDVLVSLGQAIYYRSQPEDELEAYINGIKWAIAIGNQMDILISEEERDIVMNAYLADLPEELIDFSPVMEKQEADVQPDLSNITEYMDALRAEIGHLQKNGGKQYRISNGVLIRQTELEYTYCFDLEAELYVADETQVTLIVKGEQIKGTVIICEEFQVFIVISRHLGQTVKNAKIIIESWWLLQSLSEKILLRTHNSTIARKLVGSGPDLSSADEKESKITTGQERAVLRSSNEDITVIWGPPGTGKTFVIAQIAIQAMKAKKRVLIVSHSNVSVDGIVNEISRQIKACGKDDILKRGKILRYGYVHDERLASSDYLVAHNYALYRHPELYKRIKKLEKEKRDLGTRGDLLDKHTEISREMRSIRDSIHDDEIKHVKKADILATTISKVTVDPLFEHVMYDTVLFDEASMAYVLHIVCAATYANKHFVCVGDFRQLPPITQSNIKSARLMTTDFFSFLKVNDSEGNIYYHPWMVMLDEQRRMHPDISSFVNQYVYRQMLRDHPSVKQEREAIVISEPFSGHALNLIDLKGMYCSSFKDEEGSRFNILSAFVSFTNALKMEREGIESVCMISPYRAQTRLLRAMIRDFKKEKETNVISSTIHQFQGSERDAVIFDAVESYPEKNVGWLLRRNENKNVMRLINVAVTRARGKLLLVCNGKFWENKFEGTSHLLKKLIGYINEQGNVLRVEDRSLQKYVPEMWGGRYIHNYTDLERAVSKLIEDIDKAHSKIIISIPDTRFSDETHERIMASLLKARRRGVRLLCKVGNYKELPEDWKTIAFEAENAVFPLIVIDSEIVWYGLPVSKGEFREGNRGYLTVCPVYLRVSGKHTVDFIVSSADLERVEKKNQYSQLIEKKTDKEALLSKERYQENSSSEMNVYGIRRYIGQFITCRNCNQPMGLAIGRTNKPYLRCPVCNQTDMLTKDVVNQYIERDRVVCPECYSRIHAALTRGKIMVVCSNSHFTDVDRI